MLLAEAPDIFIRGDRSCLWKSGTSRAAFSKHHALAFRPSGATRPEARHLFHRDAALKAPLFHGTKSCAALTAQAAAR